MFNFLKPKPKFRKLYENGLVKVSDHWHYMENPPPGYRPFLENLKAKLSEHQYEAAISWVSPLADAAVEWLTRHRQPMAANQLFVFAHRPGGVLAVTLPQPVNAVEIDPTKSNPEYSLLGESFIHSLAHEMIHVQQNLSGRLSHRVGQKGPIWEGQKYQEATTDEEYENLPWEVEARTKGDILAQRMLQNIPRALVEEPNKGLARSRVVHSSYADSQL